MNPDPVKLNAEQVLDLARKTFEIEAAAVLGLAKRLGGEFAQAVELVLACQGRVVVMGMGKSGHIGRKIAATLASTGTPAMFVHPAEASHGDLGMITAQDVVLAISNSGESEELTVILPVLSRQGVPMIAITGGAQSALARHARVTLDSSVALEACPLNLAPTASTTAQLAMGDALAVALLDVRGFREEDFARSHPGGALGRASYPFVLLGMPVLGLVPPIVLLGGLLGLVANQWLVWAAIAVIVSILFWAALYRYMGESAVYAFLYPLGFAMLFVIALRGVVRGRRVEWKQRSYLSS